MSKEVSKNNVEETVKDTVVDTMEQAQEAVTNQEPEITVGEIEKKSFWKRQADRFAKYRKPLIRVLEVTAVAVVCGAIYNATKQTDNEDVIDGDFTRLDDEE